VTHAASRPVFGPVTLHEPLRRRRRRLVIATLIVLALGSFTLVRYVTADSRAAYLSTDGWPNRGQGAYRLGDRLPAASPDEHPVPIASLAKVMTAVIVLAHWPLPDSSDGPTLVIGAADVADTAARRSRDESVVPVAAGERLTERQALMAVLLPSANNIAVALARQVSGTADEFVAEMNQMARTLGMPHTTYTDPSGYDPGTVSTAVDQLVLAGVAARNDTLAAMMATRSYRIPVAGTVHNTDTLLGRDGFVGMKTGSDDAAGGCFMFRSRRVVDGRTVDLVGVVLGQTGHRLVTAGLYAAKQLVDRVAPEPAG
jgi:serine-type D-Ala-D-Ala carboxypeptidase (penicillin-binding protein 5/6)